MKRRAFWVPVVLTIFSCACYAQQKQGAGLEGRVIVLDKVFEIKDLGRERKVRIYLPPGYDSSNEAYPVMYMHDGQNLFDTATAYAGEWEVDENLNELSKRDGLQVIVVGIDNGQEHRNTELIPWENDRIGAPEGEAYMTFVVDEVKPYIDKRYRTKPEREHTAIMGSSLGGLMSHYAIYIYPEIFSKAGILSPSYWVSEEVFSLTETRPVPEDSRLYLLVGGKEGAVMNDPFKRMHKLILEKGHPKMNIHAKVNPEGRHNEKFWNSEFKEIVKWLFSK